MAFKFSQRSLDNLKGVHPDLVAVAELALRRTPIDFMVIEGTRTLARQKELVRRGASKTMNSRHLTGHAIDVVPIVNGEVSWDWPYYHQLAPVFKQAAADLGIDLEWGGDWRSFQDGPHWQLSWNTYDKDDMEPRARNAVADPRPIAAPPVVVQPPVPKEVQDLIDEADGEGSKTDLFNKGIEWLSGGSIVGILTKAQNMDWRIAVAAIVGAAIVFSVALYTRRSRKKKSDLALKAKYALGQVT